MNVQTIRPGLIVLVRSEITGNVTTQTTELDYDQDGVVVHKATRTDKTIRNITEFELAVSVRSQARACIARVCAQTKFGLLCPESREKDLRDAIIEARKLVSDFNNKAKTTVINFAAPTGRIARDDEEAARAVAQEIRQLLDDMATGMDRLDVTKIRAAATKARNVGQMLSPAMQKQIAEAIDAARNEAKKIVRAGEQAEIEIDAAAIAAVNTARTTFIDLDLTGEILAPAEIGRAVDLVPVKESESGKAQAAPRAIDLEI